MIREIIEQLQGYCPMTQEQAEAFNARVKQMEHEKRCAQAIAAKKYLESGSCEDAMRLEHRMVTIHKVMEEDAVPVADRYIKMSCFNELEVEEYKRIFGQVLSPEQMERIRWTWIDFHKVEVGRMACNK